jgi:hypothetical protein
MGERDKDTEHDADGDGRSSNDVLESAADRENCATASLCCNVSAHGGGDSEPSSGTATDTFPASQPWMADAGFLRPRLVRHLLLKIA